MVRLLKKHYGSKGRPRGAGPFIATEENPRKNDPGVFFDLNVKKV
jgi:hypothetical protein